MDYLEAKPKDLEPYYFGDDEAGRVCIICDKAVPGRGTQNVERHLITHHFPELKRKIYCRYCDHHASSPDDIKKHLKRVHKKPVPQEEGKDKSVECLGCGVVWYSGLRQFTANHVITKACPDPEDERRPLNLHGRNWSRRLCAFVPAPGCPQVEVGPALDDPPHHSGKTWEIARLIRKDWNHFLIVEQHGTHAEGVQALDKILEKVQEAEEGSLHQFLERRTYNRQVYIEYMPHSNRYFYVDQVGLIHEHSFPPIHEALSTQASISHRVARMHGTSKEDWERKMNRYSSF